jgi:CDP-diacylglycerol--serine O-phosphatidyltransferase
MAMLAGFASILFTVEGMVWEKPVFFRISALLIMLAMILDGLDGNLARFLNGQSDFGAELDTYVDMTAFGIAPAILVFGVSPNVDVSPFWCAIIPSAVIVSGMVRLARFKAKDPLRGQAGYAGLPITANAAWVAMFVSISQTSPAERWFSVLFLVGIVLFTVLQVTNIRYPKPTKHAGMFVLCVILVVLLLVAGISGWKQTGLIVSKLIIALGLGYVIIGPLFVKAKDANRLKTGGPVAKI